MKRILALLVALAMPRLGVAEAQAPTAWWPTTGAVILSGGALDDRMAIEILDRMVMLAGGPDANIVIIPSADESLPTNLPKDGPQPPNIQDLRQLVVSHGLKHVQFLHTRDPNMANSKEFADMIRSAQAVFITGGASALLHVYRNTAVEREIRALLARGGVLVGDSAGAIALSCCNLTWLPRPFGNAADQLAALPRIAVSPHVNKARGFVVDSEVIKYARAHRQTVGVDIDENTLLILRGAMAEVVGTGYVSVIDVMRDPTKPYLRMAPGTRRDLSK
jgi:cyanophycinase